MEVKNVPLSQVVIDENQPRKLFEPGQLKNLADSVKRFGIMEPLQVEKSSNGKYLLVDGERRFRVATDLKLETVPVIVLKAADAMERRLRQFHIQEQHADWTPTEKAIAISELAEKHGVGLKQICELLAVPERTAGRYLAFASIVDKKAWYKNDIGIEWVEAVKNLKTFVRKLYLQNDQVFTREDEVGLERAIISRVKTGELKQGAKNITRIRDSFTKDFKLVDKFINGSIGIDEMFIKAKAQGAYHLRNAYVSAGYLASNLKAYFKHEDVEPTKEQLYKLKEAYDELGIILEKADKLD